ncbi:MAG TPA: hypothetical protein DCF68_16755 [Cyanothece sp. UBA12306]|nr:hypothetical protein [Cyanothece sp. UBA12306]
MNNSLKFSWIQWAIGTAIAFLTSLLWVEIGEPRDLGTIEGTIGGTIIGCFQALILSRWLPQSWLWMIATLIPWGLMGGSNFGLIGWVAPRTDSWLIRLVVGLIFGAITGFWTGIWQWLVLRTRLSGSQWWIIINSLSWSVGLSLGWLVGGLLRWKTHLFLGEVIGLGITWILVGIQTGIGLGKLLERNFPTLKSRPSAKI